jgi:hypothetical protein
MVKPNEMVEMSVGDEHVRDLEEVPGGQAADVTEVE